MRLPARQRQVVALRLFLDLDTARTAQVLGIAPSTVKAHLARATAAVMVIHSSAIPRDAGVAINPPAQPPVTRVALGLVRASRPCTGG